MLIFRQKSNRFCHTDVTFPSSILRILNSSHILCSRFCSTVLGGVSKPNEVVDGFPLNDNVKQSVSITDIISQRKLYLLFLCKALNLISTYCPKKQCFKMKVKMAPCIFAVNHIIYLFV